MPAPPPLPDHSSAIKTDDGQGKVISIGGFFLAEILELSNRC
jgi:hypothetical protein